MTLRRTITRQRADRLRLVRQRTGWEPLRSDSKPLCLAWLDRRPRFKDHPEARFALEEIAHGILIARITARAALLRFDEESPTKLREFLSRLIFLQLRHRLRHYRFARFSKLSETEEMGARLEDTGPEGACAAICDGLFAKTSPGKLLPLYLVELYALDSKGLIAFITSRRRDRGKARGLLDLHRANAMPGSSWRVNKSLTDLMHALGRPSGGGRSTPTNAELKRALLHAGFTNPTQEDIVAARKQFSRLSNRAPGHDAQIRVH